MKKNLQDPAIWFLLASNLIILVHYINVPDSIDTVIVLFWIQSVLIGIFNALDIFSATHIVTNSYSIKGPTPSIKINAGIYFLFFYGIFHLAYAMFLATLITIHRVDWQFVVLSFWFLLAGSLTGFIQNKLRNRKEAMHLGNMFFMPFGRIIPMHMAILIPSFLHISIGVVFILFKILADVMMYIVYQKSIFKPMVSVGN